MDWVKANLEEIVKRAMAVKIKIIEEDPYEKGIRAALNLGHTVGHAVELVSGFELRHGEAIAIGMVAEAGTPNGSELRDKGLSRIRFLQSIIQDWVCLLRFQKICRMSEIIRRHAGGQKEECKGDPFCIAG
jgi:3-dehydroquinate synthetase